MQNLVYIVVQWRPFIVTMQIKNIMYWEKFPYVFDYLKNAILQAQDGCCVNRCNI